MEIVPTQLRGQGSGLANVAAQASTFFSPYIVYSVMCHPEMTSHISIKSWIPYLVRHSGP